MFWRVRVDSLAGKVGLAVHWREIGTTRKLRALYILQAESPRSKPQTRLSANRYRTWRGERVKGETPLLLCPIGNENSDLLFIYFWGEEVGKGFHLSPFSPSVTKG